MQPNKVDLGLRVNEWIKDIFVVVTFFPSELMHMFKESREAIEQFLNHDDWHFWVTMKQGTVTMPVFQSLEAFWPGILSLIGDNIGGLKSIHNYHQVKKTLLGDAQKWCHATQLGNYMIKSQKM